MERIYGWYENENIDRAPIRFSSRNEQNKKVLINDRRHITAKNYRFDSEYQELPACYIPKLTEVLPDATCFK